MNLKNKKMKRLVINIIFITCLCVIYGCNNKKDSDETISFFKSNESKFDNVILYLKNNHYLLNDTLKYTTVVDCDAETYKKNCICADKNLIKMLKNINISNLYLSSSIEKCDTTLTFNEIELISNDDNNISFIYSFCDYSYSSRSSENINKKELTKNWTLLISK